jgi:ABC-type branched-subunit amino acid transport system substrate-binding protein
LDETSPLSRTSSPPKKGIRVVADEPYSKGSPDYRSTLTKIKAHNPDLVFMVSYVADTILLMRQSREIGLQPQAFLGGGAGFTTVQFAKKRPSPKTSSPPPSGPTTSTGRSCSPSD